jgi:hypothetical protein
MLNINAELINCILPIVLVSLSIDVWLKQLNP